MKPKYKRILLKLSGEGLMGNKPFGICGEEVLRLCKQIKQIHDLGVEICLVIGGGNIFRGAKEAASGMDRSMADQVGMLATVMNALYLQDCLLKLGVDTRVMSGLQMPEVCEPYVYQKAVRHLKKGRVLIFAAGTGCPYFTTDTGAALRASEMHCEAIFKATQVDGVYDSDPRYNDKAKRFEQVSYDEVIEKKLKIMDISAVVLAKESKIRIIVFRQQGEDSLMDAVCGKGLFTTVK